MASTGGQGHSQRSQGHSRSSLCCMLQCITNVCYIYHRKM